MMMRFNKIYTSVPVDDDEKVVYQDMRSFRIMVEN